MTFNKKKVGHICILKEYFTQKLKYTHTQAFQ